MRGLGLGLIGVGLIGVRLIGLGLVPSINLFRKYFEIDVSAHKVPGLPELKQ